MDKKTLNQLHSIIEVFSELEDQREEIDWLKRQLDNCDSALKHFENLTEALTEERDFWRDKAEKSLAILSGIGLNMN